MEKVIDFIKSWLYYPKLSKWFEDENIIELDIWNSRLKYAIWHCQVGKLKPNENSEDEIIYSSDWKCQYK